MANFSTHLTVGVLTSAAAGILLSQAHLVSPARAALLVGVGTIGSLLPDVDAGNSVPARWIRATVSTTVAVIVGLVLWPTQGVPIVAAWALLALIVTYGVVEQLVTRLTVHRGVIHSVPFAALIGGLAILGAHRLAGFSTKEAWYAGAFLAAGFVVHLCLDEIASVDLTSARVKRSFGTALKLWSRQNWLGTLAVYVLLGVVISRLPSPHGFWRDVARLVRWLS